MVPSAKYREGRTLRVVLGVLAAAGLLISAYLSWIHFAGVAPVCVGGGNGGCETVQSSRYATVLGVPVSVLGLVGYSGLLASAVLRGEVGVYLGFLIALIGTLFSGYLTYLEVFVIHAICQWCLASAAIMVAALICASISARRLTEHER
jgi:uncharacterized membrane protein